MQQRVLWLVMTFLATSLTVFLPSAASARPVCDENSDGHIKTWSAGEQWHTTAAHSDWGTGGTNVSVEIGKKATNSIRKVESSTSGFDVGAAWGPISASYNYSHTSKVDTRHAVTNTIEVKYTRQVPPKHQARMMRWGIQKLIGVKKYRLVYSPAKDTCVSQTIYTATVAGATRGGAFIWDMQDRQNQRPGCKIRDYISYGSCPTLKN